MQAERHQLLGCLVVSVQLDGSALTAVINAIYDLKIEVIVVSCCVTAASAELSCEVLLLQITGENVGQLLGSASYLEVPTLTAACEQVRQHTPFPPPAYLPACPSACPACLTPLPPSSPPAVHTKCAGPLHVHPPAHPSRQIQLPAAQG